MASADPEDEYNCSSAAADWAAAAAAAAAAAKASDDEAGVARAACARKHGENGSDF